MRKAILEFTMPEDEDHLKTAMRGMEYWSALWHIQEYLREIEKYGLSESEAIIKIKDIIQDQNLNDIS